VAAALVWRPASADRVTDAEELFRRARALMSQERYDQACPLLTESYRLDPGPGTLVNLALCHEKIGRVAAAWGEFTAVEQQARAATPPNDSRALFARQHAEALEPRLSRLRITVPDEARAPGLVVKVDGEPKTEALWGGVVVDAGTRVVEVSAQGKKTLSLPVKIDDEGVLRSVTIPALEDAPVVPPEGRVTGDLADVEAYAASRARRTTGFVVAGVGLAMVVTGSALGVAAILADDEAHECNPCYAGSPEARDSDRATDRALLFANVSNVVLPLGIIGAAVGTYLVLSARGPRRAALAPALSPRASGFSLSGSW